MHRARFQKWEWVAIAAIAVARLWLTAVRTLRAIGWASIDDNWFLQRARSIMAGQWMGPYNHLTLIKGAGYPLWIAAISSLHIPLLFAQQLLYTIACLAICRAVAPSVRSAPARVALFVVLVFNPMSYANDIADRVSREGIYPALCLLVAAGVAGTLLRLNARRRDVLPWVILGGLAFALLWHTREESIWIAPLPALAAAGVLAWAFGDRQARWKRAVLVLVPPVLFLAAAHAAIVLTNGLRYGVWSDVEFKWRPYVLASGSLNGVRQHPPVPHTPVPKEVRERVYAVSPAFAEIRPLLEGQLGTDWKRGNADLENGTFMWAFREAVEKRGYYARGSAAVAGYYNRISREIDEARLSGRLDAREARASLLPPLLPGQRQDIVSRWFFGARRLATFSSFAASPTYSEGSDEELREFVETTRTPLTPRAKSIEGAHLVAWIIHAEGSLDVSVEHSDGTSVPGARVTHFPTPDLYDHLKMSWKDFPPARNAGFEIDAQGPDVELVLSLHGRPIDRIVLSTDSPGPHHPLVRMGVYRYERTVREPDLSSMDVFRFAVLNAVAHVYQVTFPLVLAAALLLFILTRRANAGHRGDWTIAIVIGGIFAAIAARVMILAIIDVTSFAVFFVAYESPAYPLLLAGTFLAAQQGVVALRARRPVAEPSS
ncbi:MAG TPA: hypothetical protein VNN08_09000 [Thermoanaerobaculia bacterium]|nr:hypothetical protein [Thermoanaerobaculia bacterium]